MDARLIPTMLVASGILATALVPVAHATDILTSRLSGQAVYDANTNLTWVSNANLAATNTFGVSDIVNGFMTQTTAESWIGGMNAANYLGYSDWRLPTTVQPDPTCSIQSSIGDSYGTNCTGSEMGNLFYNGLGQVAGFSITNVHNANYSLFSNVQSFYYWSGTGYTTIAASAWYFRTNYGVQDFYKKNGHFDALAVRSGDVAAVPEPGTWAMLLAGLGLVGVAVRRRRELPV